MICGFWLRSAPAAALRAFFKRLDGRLVVGFQHGQVHDAFALHFNNAVRETES